MGFLGNILARLKVAGSGSPTMFRIKTHKPETISTLWVLEINKKRGFRSYNGYS